MRMLTIAALAALANNHGKTGSDLRDAAAACRLALETNIEGHTILNVAAPTSTMRESTDELIRRFMPEVGKKRELSGNWSGMDSTKAEALLRFKAKHSWQKYLTV